MIQKPEEWELPECENNTRTDWMLLAGVVVVAMFLSFCAIALMFIGVLG